MLTTLLRPTAGLGPGRRLRRRDARRRRCVAAIGVALQDAAIDPLMTGTELLRLQAVLHGLASPRGRSARGAELLERVGLTAAADRRVGHLLRAGCVAASTWRSRCPRTAVLFLDEPTTGLDPTSRLALWEEVRRLNTEHGTTVFLTTQYLEEADQLAGRSAIIDGGRIVREGATGGAEGRGRRARPCGSTCRPGPAPRSPARCCLGRFGSHRPAREGRVAIGLDRRAPLADGRGGAGPRRRRRRGRTTSSSTRRASTTCSPRRPGAASRARPRRPRDGIGRSRSAPRSPARSSSRGRAHRRSIRRQRPAQPVQLHARVVFPLLLAAVYTAQFQRALDLPGFPEVDSFLDFILPAAILQSIAFGATDGRRRPRARHREPASSTASSRRRSRGRRSWWGASPVRRSRPRSKTLVLMAVFLAFGARDRSRAYPARSSIVATGVLLALAIGGLGQVIALRTGSQEAVNATFPLRVRHHLHQLGVLPDRADGRLVPARWPSRNPITWIIDPVRRLVISGWSWSDVGQAIGITAALAVASPSRWRCRVPASPAGGVVTRAGARPAPLDARRSPRRWPCGRCSACGGGRRCSSPPS